MADIGTAYLYGIGAGSVNRESVADMVVNTDPFDTPLHNLAPKVAARHTTEEWLEDTLAATSTAGRPEGQAFNADTVAAASRKINITQIFGKHVAVSETQQVVSPYGFSDTFLYEVMKGTREVMRNIENRLFAGSDGSVVGTVKAISADGTARVMKSLDDFLTTNKHHAGSTALGFSAMQGSAAASLNEGCFNAMLQKIYENGGNPGWCFAGPAYKRKISAFAGNPLVTGSASITLNINASEQAIIRSINSYLSDFGLINIVLDRWAPVSSAATGANSLKGRIYFLELPRVQIAYLRPLRFRRLAADGDRVRGMVVGELTLKVMAEKGSGVMYGISTA